MAVESVDVDACQADVESTLFLIFLSFCWQFWKDLVQRHACLLLTFVLNDAFLLQIKKMFIVLYTAEFMTSYTLFFNHLWRERQRNAILDVNF